MANFGAPSESHYSRVFPQFTKLAMLTFLYCVNFENKLDKVTSYTNFKSIHCDKYESAKVYFSW